MDNIKKLLFAYQYIRERKFLKCSPQCFLCVDDISVASGLFKSIIISIYAIWESFVKDRISDFYKNNHNYLYNQTFIRNYIEVAISNSYTKAMLLESVLINDTNQLFLDIKKEILCASNNMKLCDCFNILGKINIDVDMLKNNINNNHASCFVNLRNLIERLIDLGLPIQKKKTIDSLEEFFKILVDARNSISHTFTCNETFTQEQLECFIEIIKCMEEIINRSLNFEQKKLEIVHNQTCLTPIIFKEVIKSNTGNENNSAILHVVTNTNILKTDNYIVIKKDDSMFVGRILRIKDKDSKDVNETKLNCDYTLELDTDLVIRKNMKACNIFSA